MTTHGTSNAYNRGCRCADCTEAARVRWHDYVKRLYLNRGPLMCDPTGTRRRLQALCAIGWSYSDLARHLGVTPQNVYNYTRATATTQRIRDLVKDLYDDLSMTPGPSSYARTNARRHGWPPPLAWDDVVIDDPTCHADRKFFHTENVPDLKVDDGLLDDIAIERFIAGDLNWRKLSTAERLEGAVRMDRAGVSRNVIAERTHLNSRTLWDHLRAQDPSARDGSIAS